MELITPALKAFTARVETLEREKGSRGEFVEVFDRGWLADIEVRIIATSDKFIVESERGHANLMTALTLHRRISNLERG